MDSPYSVYVHIPFCSHRCSYCDFNTYAGMHHFIAAYVRAVCREIGIVSQAAGQRLPVHTVFFGGGTPSLLGVEDVSSILQAIGSGFDLDPGAEVSLEANPGSVTRPYLSSLRRVGVNRLSIGMQSSHPQDLSLLERLHNYYDVIQAVEWACQAGLDNLSLDLIFGLPGQSIARWEETLAMALGLHPDHISLYALTVEEGTPLHPWVQHGLVPQVDEDTSAEMYELAGGLLTQAGFEQYEISNWARIDHIKGVMTCRHNLQYWRNQPYFGFGAGAHGYAGGQRTANVLTIPEYITRLHADGPDEFPLSPATIDVNKITRSAEIEETMITGLRLTREGIRARVFEQRFGFTLEEAFGKEIDELQNVGLIEWAEDPERCLRLTFRGRLLGNQVFLRFLGVV